MLIEYSKLLRVIKAIVCKLDINSTDAEIIASSYIEADLCGIETHGLSTFPEHFKKLKNKIYNLQGDIKVIKEEVSFSVIDGNNCIGPVSATKVMNYAIMKAKEVGMYTCFVNNANTFGAASIYNNIAIDNKMIGIIFSNSPAAMAPINGKEKLLGTNPIAISIPTKNENPIIFDIATSEVAKSKIKQAAIRNEKIPLNWATDLEGNPTSDPNEAIKGLVLPMAGYKGYGLSMCIDILSGLISGANYLNQVGKFYDTNTCMNIGYTIMILDPSRILDSSFYEKMDKYIKTIKESKRVDGAIDINIPGENRITHKKEFLKNGIFLNDNIYNEIKKLLDEYEIGYLLD